MKRIGILTLPLHTNIGGVLQAFALQNALEKTHRGGYKVSVINRKPALFFAGYKLEDIKIPRWRHFLSFVKRALLRYICRIDVYLDMRREWLMQRLAYDRGFEGFIKRYICSDYYDRVEDIKAEDYDTIVVGSDQIWRPLFMLPSWGTNDHGVAFLSFTKGWDIKRYAYAASFGTDSWEFPTEKDDEYAALAQAFLGISVREDTGVDLCREHLGVEARHVLDPTMLLTADDYMHLVDAAGVDRSSGNLFCYILDSNMDKCNLIRTIARSRGLKNIPFRNTPDSKALKSGEGYIPVIETWLRAFHDAEFVVTDSFHGCAFSIIFGKPFVAVGNVERGLSRMQSLMKMFGIEDHLITKASEYDPQKGYALPPSVSEQLNILRQEAREFISRIE